MNSTLEHTLEPTPTLEQAPFAAPQARRLPCNVGLTEQRIRLVAGTALIAAAIGAPVSRGWRMTFAGLGIMEIVTGSSRYCPMWHALHVNSLGGKLRRNPPQTPVRLDEEARAFAIV